MLVIIYWNFLFSNKKIPEKNDQCIEHTPWPDLPRKKKVWDLFLFFRALGIQIFGGDKKWWQGQWETHDFANFGTAQETFLLFHKLSD